MSRELIFLNKFNVPSSLKYQATFSVKQMPLLQNGIWILFVEVFKLVFYGMNLNFIKKANAPGATGTVFRVVGQKLCQKYFHFALFHRKSEIIVTQNLIVKVQHVYFTAQ